MPAHDIVVVGASAGGVEALSELVHLLPRDLPAALFVVLHITPDHTSTLPLILGRKGALPAAHAEDGEKIHPSRIYVAPPDRHLLVKRGYVRVTLGPRENGHRPAIDPLFRTPARAYGPRVVGVVLSGSLDDGTAGLVAIKQQGGVTLVQDPESALYSGMPRSAIESGVVDAVLPLPQIARRLIDLAQRPVATNGDDPAPADLEMESEMAEFDLDALQDFERPGRPSVYTCPECHGTLWELHEGDVMRFRCRVGHAFTARTLLTQQSDALESALWTALRSLEETADLRKRLAERFARRGHRISAERFDRQSHEAQESAALVREVLMNGFAIGAGEEQAVEQDAGPPNGRQAADG
jgi:two-component system chemotaxis response regulator CheB